jgi:hypothetical protein
MQNIEPVSNTIINIDGASKNHMKKLLSVSSAFIRQNPTYFNNQTININISTIPDRDFSLGNCVVWGGYCAITIEKAFKFDRYKTIVHELVHASQYFRGDLKLELQWHYQRNWVWMMIWKGKRMFYGFETAEMSLSEYQRLPWEVEANQKAEQFLKQYPPNELTV